MKTNLQIISNINGAPGGLGGCISGQIINNSSSWSQFKIYNEQGLSLPFWIGSYGTYLGDMGWTNDGGKFIGEAGKTP